MANKPVLFYGLEAIREAGITDVGIEVNRMVLETAEARQHGTVDAGSEIIGRVVIESDAQVSGSRIVGPVARPTLERFLPWNANPEDLRTWAQPPPDG